MPLPELPLELLLMIAHLIRDDHGEFRYGDFNSFLQVNRALYTCLNRMLWKEAGAHEFGTQRVLTHLIKTNNPSGLKFFLELDADVEARLPAFDIKTLASDEVGAELEQLAPTPLLVVAAIDNVPLARLLLEKGAKVRYFDWDCNSKFSPLHAARSAEMVQLLLDHNADPHFRDETERQPLHWYAMRDNIAAMRAILQHGAEVNPIGSPEMPLHEAAQRNLDSVELLVEHGADVEARDFKENTPLHLAAWKGKTDVVKFLLGQWPEGMRERDYFLNTPLHLAAFRGSIETVAVLVEGWPEAIREKNQAGDTPLCLAARSFWLTSRAEVVKLLVEHWPEGKEALNHEGETPLSRFEEDWKYSGLRYLLSDEKKEEIIALLGGPYSEANKN
jgi:ankyrin repeat protein